MQDYLHDKLNQDVDKNFVKTCIQLRSEE